MSGQTLKHKILAIVEERRRRARQRAQAPAERGRATMASTGKDPATGA
ncbi:MAG: hypothetical protein IPG04_40090 [Polyangiaceae bacterium]|nr:hypothetical protein [Polyangiaceae bacterium]